MLAQPPGAAGDELVGRRADVVRRRERAVLERLLQHVLGHDGQTARDTAHRAGAACGLPVLMTTVYGSGAVSLKFLPLDLQHLLHRRMQRLVVDDLEREQHVLRGDRMPVGKCRAFAQVERPRHAVGRDLPRFRQPGSYCCVAMSKSTRKPNRRSVMSVDDVSFAIMRVERLRDCSSRPARNVRRSVRPSAAVVISGSAGGGIASL